MSLPHALGAARDLRGATGRRRWAAVFAGAMALGVLSSALDDGPVPALALVLLLTGTLAVAVAVLVVRWGEAGPIGHVLPMLALVALIGVERHVVADGASVTPLSVLPVLWIALHGRRPEILTVLVADLLVLVLPVLLIGAPRYPPSELRPAWMYVVVLALTAFVVSELVRAVRRRERDTAELVGRLSALLDATGDLPVVGTDPSGRIEVFNAGAQRSLGYRPEEVLGRPYAVLLDGADLARSAAERGVGTDELLGGLGEAARTETWSYRRKDGSTFPAEVTISPVRSGSGEPQGHLAVAHDVTARVSAAQRLERARDDLSRVAAAVRRVHVGDDVRAELVDEARALADAQDVHLVEPVDPDTLMVVRSTSARLSGFTFALDPVRWATARAWQQGVRQVVSDTSDPPFPLGSQTLEKTRDGALLWEPVHHRDRQVAILVVSWDRPQPAVQEQLGLVELLAAEAGTLLELDDAKRRLDALARTDPLTGLPNRRAWDQALAVELSRAQRDGRPLVVAIADLDHFKRYNDAYGHHAGDVVLCEFARLAREGLRGIDVLARWGGEEFVLALPDCTLEAAGEALERVRAAVPGQETCSIGYALWDGAETSMALVGRADRALYRAKAQGRDRSLADTGEEGPPSLRVVRAR